MTSQQSDHKYENNPAGRLWRILSQVDKHAGNKPQNARLREGLRLALAFEEDKDLREITIAYAEIMSLPDAARVAFENLEGKFDPSVHLKWYDPVVNSLNSTPVNGTLQSWKANITEGVLQSLQGLADLLSALAPQATLTKEQLENISIRCEALLEDVTEADEIPPDVRLFLIGHLERFSSAFRHYRIHGTVDLQHEFDRSIGEVVRRRNWLEKLTSNRNVREFFKLLGWINLALNFGGTALELLPWDPTPELSSPLADGESPSAEPDHGPAGGERQ